MEMSIWDLHRDGFCLLNGAFDVLRLSTLNAALCEEFDRGAAGVLARSNQGHAVAARNLIDSVPTVQTVWQCDNFLDFLRRELGENLGLVRALFFDKPPDRTWGLAWHKDRAIAVKDNSRLSPFFSRPTVKAGVPHVIACDQILTRMLTLRIHLDEVTDENGPLEVIPGSHVSSDATGVGIAGAIAIHAKVGDVLAMRPLITHGSGASKEGTQRHRRILHLEFAADPLLPDGYQWQHFVSAQSKSSMD